MVERAAKPAENTAMSDAISVARMRVELLALPIGWHETKESRRARVARKIGTTARRVRAILAGEKIRLAADEYLAIERAYLASGAALASLSALARDADIRAGDRHEGRGGGAAREGVPADRHERAPTPPALPGPR